MSRTQNTSIAKRRFGCRLPYESPDVGNGYASSGPVKEYRLSPEELARYGPVKKVQHSRPKLTRELLADQLARFTVGQMAERYHVPQEIIFQLVEKYDLELDDKNRLKEDKNMDTATHQTENNFQNYPEEQGKKKTRFEIAREKITLEQYKTMKAQGKTDKDMYESLDIPVDCFYALKKEWGIAQAKRAEPKEETQVQHDEAKVKPANKITIASALELREQLAEEMDSVGEIKDSGVMVAPLVEELLEKHFAECQSNFDRIEEVFNATEIEV